MSVCPIKNPFFCNVDNPKLVFSSICRLTFLNSSCHLILQSPFQHLLPIIIFVIVKILSHFHETYGGYKFHFSVYTPLYQRFLSVRMVHYCIGIFLKHVAYFHFHIGFLVALFNSVKFSP